MIKFLKNIASKIDNYLSESQINRLVKRNFLLIEKDYIRISITPVGINGIYTHVFFTLNPYDKGAEKIYKFSYVSQPNLKNKKLFKDEKQLLFNKCKLQLKGTNIKIIM